MTESERLLKILSTLNLPIGQWVLAGSGSMVLRGLERPRSMGDVDIFCATRLWFAIYEESLDRIGINWPVFTTDPNDRKRRCDPPYLFRTIGGLEVNIFHSWRQRGVGDINVGMWIYNAELVQGFPCVRLQFILDWKKSVGRDKDQDDIRIIEEYMRRAA